MISCVRCDTDIDDSWAISELVSVGFGKISHSKSSLIMTLCANCMIDLVEFLTPDYD